MDPQTFAVATTVSDPLTAERLVQVLNEAGHDAFVRPGGAASSDGFAAAATAHWDVLVPVAAAEAVASLVRQELEAIERDAEANAQAAEEEALSGETPTAE